MPANKTGFVVPSGARDRESCLTGVQLQQVIEGLPAWVQVCRLDSTIESVNRAATEISGYPASQLVGMSWPYPWLDVSEAAPAGHKPGSVSTWPYLQPNCNNGRPLEFEAACRTLQGETRPLSVTLSLLRAEDGHAERVVLMAWDLTSRKRMELETGQAQKVQVVNQLASGVAHDINNNLAVILGYSEYLLTKLDNPDEDVQQALSAIQEQSLECADTVRRIELSVNPMSGRHFSPVDVNEALREVVLAAQPLWEGQSDAPIRVETALGPVPPVQGHRASVREILTSLISNATEAMPQGGVISLRTRQDGDAVVVEVQDSGVGIPAGDLQRVFDPFFTTKGPSRSGLGLSIAYNLTTQQGGAIQVASRPGSGATFSLRLPVSSPMGKAPATTQPGELLRTALSVLVVDDEPQVAGVLKSLLQSLGHRVMVCPDGATALETFLKERFDLAVVDLGMPVMDGWELSRRLNRQRPGFPILVATGWDVSREDLERSGALVRTVVRKPFILKDLAAAVDQAVAVTR